MRHKDISFEFFTSENILNNSKAIYNIKQTEPLKPSFISIANKGCKNNISVIEDIKNNTEQEIVPHLPCLSLKNNENIAGIIKKYETLNINKILVIRGDDQGIQHKNTSNNIVTKTIEKISKASTNEKHIIIGAYPEGHPKSISQTKEMEHLKQKVSAGAKSIITQYFYDAEHYFRFRDKCHAYDIDIPIIPGILPIYDIEKTIKLSISTGVKIPKKIIDRLQGKNYLHQQKHAIEEIIKMCIKLIDGEAPSLHFYTMNNYFLSKKIIIQLFT